MSELQPRRILLATDLSARCDRALDRAAVLATECAAELTVVHAFERELYGLVRDPRPTPSWRQEPNLKREIAKRQIHEDLGTLDVPFDLILEEGAPADVIIKAAEELGADIIVTGIARGETFGRFIFGGTVERLVRQAKRPVLVVKSRARQPYKDILVATDFSEESRRAILSTARMFPKANLTLMHCYDSVTSAMVPSEDASQAGREFALLEYREFLNKEAVTALDIAKLPIFMEKGSIDCVIRDYAAHKSLDLLVIGSQGKNAITRALFGSTAERAMASAPTDVLVIIPERSS